MISIFTNISSISTVSFPFPPGVTRCRKRLMDTERSPWTEISIRTGWIWVIRRGPVRSMYTVSRAYNNGRSRVEELLTSASKDSSSFVHPLWSMCRTMGTMTCILINSVTTRLQDTAVRFLRLWRTYSWNAEERNFLTFSTKIPLFISLPFSPSVGRLAFWDISALPRYLLSIFILSVTIRYLYSYQRIFFASSFFSIFSKV